MSGEAVAVMSILDRLQERARRLEKEAAELRSDLEDVAKALSRPVAVYEIDGERVVITEADVEAVRAQLVRPHPEEAIRELALIHKLAEREKDVPEPEIRRRIAGDIEAIRAEAIAKGLAIDDPMEAVVGD